MGEIAHKPHLHGGMIRFPPAKINLGLNVLHKRPDGYHDIESVLIRIPLCDALEVIVDPGLPPGRVAFARTGISVPGEPHDDLCMKAIDLLRAHHELPGLRAHLHKVIPIGAGLGGGSSDGAMMLVLINDLLDLGLGAAELSALAERLGSDAPFFLTDGPCLVEGRGERLTAIDLDLNGCWIVIVHPALHVSTAEVYAHTAPTGHTAELAHIAALGLTAWRSRLVNVMEHHVFNRHPEVARIKHRLYSHGAVYASMSGSGSTVYGLFTAPPDAMEWPDSHRAWTFRMR